MARGEEAADAGKRRALSVELIVDETLALIDEQGLGVASMRTIGERLGVRAMSLYRYVSSREDLFDLVVERIVDELEADDDVLTEPVDGWRDYLSRLARGVRRYARSHPHAFPLVATRPPQAPWINPPLRSLRWVETMLAALHDQGFDDDQMLFVYRSFNSFLLGYLLLETSAMALSDPKPGDGSFQSSDAGGDGDPADAADPVPGGLSPARSTAQRLAVGDAETPGDKIDPVGEVDQDRYPLVGRLRAGLTADVWDEEFEVGLTDLLERVERVVADPS